MGFRGNLSPLNMLIFFRSLPDDLFLLSYLGHSSYLCLGELVLPQPGELSYPLQGKIFLPYLKNFPLST
jgi:hypothetical protein